MRTLLLLAGRSKRFWPLTDKTLFPVAGTTLVQHQVKTLMDGGCKDITLIVGAHNKKEMKAMFPKLTIVEQKDLDLGMQGACLDGLKGVKEPVLIVSGNDVIESSAIKTLIEASKKPKIDGAILARKVKKYFPGGYLTVKSGKIMKIVEKPGEGKEPSDLINLVAHIHNDPQKLLGALKLMKSTRDDGYEAALQSLFDDCHYKAVPYTGIWQAVKFPWHLLPLMEVFLSEIKKPSIHKSAKIHTSAIIEGNVVIGEGTRVLANAVIVGPAVIGKNCIIGNNALVRGSSIGDGSVVGYNCEVKGSVLAGPVWTHMTYLGDSIIGKNVSFGGGCITGNLRLDEGEIEAFAGDHGKAEKRSQTGLTKLGLICGDHCRFGIQVGTNPGVRVGSGSFIGGDAYLSKDIPENSFVTMKLGDLHIRENKTPVPGMETRKEYRKKI